MSDLISRCERTLPHRIFGSLWFQIPWILFLAFLVMRLWWIRDAALVSWVYGSDAYRDGVRVLPGKPIRFSTGELAPVWPDMVTGFGFFALVVFGLSGALFLSLSLYCRLRRPYAARDSEPLKK
jgi:hypothetical protein